MDNMDKLMDNLMDARDQIKPENFANLDLEKLVRFVAWVNEQTRRCALCEEVRFTAECPDSSSCHDEHISNVCKMCWDQYIATQLGNGRQTSQIPCATCDSILTEQEIKHLSDAKTYSVYSEKQVQEVLRKDPNFRTCPSATCSFGYIMTQDDRLSGSIFNCRVCEAQYCVHCEVPMHKGATCCERQTSLKRKREQEDEEDQAKTNEFLKSYAKQCPECKSWIRKNGGCEHMTCGNCEHEFCWRCFAPYQGDEGISEVGNDAHAESCPFHSGQLPEGENLDQFESDDDEDEDEDEEEEDDEQDEEENNDG